MISKNGIINVDSSNLPDIRSVVIHGAEIEKWDGEKLELYLTTDNVDVNNLKEASWVKNKEIDLTSNKYYYFDNTNSKGTGIKLVLTGSASFKFISEASVYK